MATKTKTAPKTATKPTVKTSVVQKLESSVRAIRETSEKADGLLNGVYWSSVEATRVIAKVESSKKVLRDMLGTAFKKANPDRDAKTFAPLISKILVLATRPSDSEFKGLLEDKTGFNAAYERFSKKQEAPASENAEPASNDAGEGVSSDGEPEGEEPRKNGKTGKTALEIALAAIKNDANVFTDIFTKMCEEGYMDFATLFTLINGFCKDKDTMRRFVELLLEDEDNQRYATESLEMIAADKAASADSGADAEPVGAEAE